MLGFSGSLQSLTVCMWGPTVNVWGSHVAPSQQMLAVVQTKLWISFFKQRRSSLLFPFSRVSFLNMSVKSEQCSSGSTARCGLLLKSGACLIMSLFFVPSFFVPLFSVPCSVFHCSLSSVLCSLPSTLCSSVPCPLLFVPLFCFSLFSLLCSLFYLQQ